MIEKFTKDEIESAWVEPVAGNVQSIYGKINELVDAVNELQAHSTNALTKTLCMDKEFAEDECVRLQNELDRTRKALDVAKKALNDIQFTDDGNRIVDIRSFAHHALDQITALEQKE